MPPQPRPEGTDLGELDDGELTEVRRDKFGFVFQFFNLLPVLTAEENILLPLKLAGREPDRERERVLIDEGFTLSIPVGTLVALLVLAIIAGIVAAIGPARRASRLDVLEALAYE